KAIASPNTLPCWVRLHSTLPTRVYRIPGKRSHHPTPCLLGSVALHPTYKAGNDLRPQIYPQTNLEIC
ncbi:MAG: hypothetical protein P5700_11190, partial [Arthrospira platensis PCC 7345]|nr:hypothetical protein [Arthrospira platensis PCC 7345]